MFTLFMYVATDYVSLNSSQGWLVLMLVVVQDIAFIGYMAKGNKG